MDKKAAATDFKKIYQSSTLELAAEALDEFQLNIKGSFFKLQP